MPSMRTGHDGGSWADKGLVGRGIAHLQAPVSPAPKTRPGHEAPAGLGMDGSAALRADRRQDRLPAPAAGSQRSESWGHLTRAQRTLGRSGAGVGFANRGIQLRRTQETRPATHPPGNAVQGQPQPPVRDREVKATTAWHWMCGRCVGDSDGIR
jgi:hypothetical protein